MVEIFFVFIPDRVYYVLMNIIAEFIKQKRKEAGLTHHIFSIFP